MNAAINREAASNNNNRRTPTNTTTLLSSMSSSSTIPPPLIVFLTIVVIVMCITSTIFSSVLTTTTFAKASSPTTLPPNITASGDTVCVDCTVAEGGTTLFVEDMMFALDGAQYSVSFIASNLDFTSTLTIEFPTSGGSIYDWDPGITFTVLILNGTIASASTLNNKSTTPFPLLKILGRVRGGSNITILGGNYPILGEDAITAFLELYVISIYNNSCISITGATFTKWHGKQQFNTSTSPKTFLIDSTGDLVLDGSGATLSFSGNSILMSDAVFIGLWSLFLFNSDPLRIAGYGNNDNNITNNPPTETTTSLTFSNNVLNFVNVVVADTLGVYVTVATSIVQQGPLSRFTITNNTFNATLITAPQSFLTLTQLSSDLQLALSNGGVLEWSYNDVAWSKSTISSALTHVMLAVRSSAPIHITESSSMRATGNRFTFTEMVAMLTLGVSGVVVDRRSSNIGAIQIQVTSNSIIDMSETQIIIDNISSSSSAAASSATSTITVSLFNSNYASLLVDNKSTISVQSTILTLRNCNASTQYTPVIFDSAFIYLVDFSSMMVIHNSVTMEGVDMYSWGASYLYLKKTPMSASQNSSVLVAKNGIYVYGGEMFSTSQAVFAVFSGSSLSLSASSTFTLTGSEYISTNVSGRGGSVCRLLWITKVVNITDSSTIEVSNSHVVIIVSPQQSSLLLLDEVGVVGAAEVPPPPIFYGVWLSDAVYLGSSGTTIDNSQKSAISVSGNEIVLPMEGSGVFIWLESTTRFIYVDGGLNFANNSVINITSYISISNATTTTDPTDVAATIMNLCRNFYNGAQCRAVGGEGGGPTAYDCRGGVVSVSGGDGLIELPYGQVGVSDCAGLLTRTASPTLSGPSPTPSLSGNASTNSKSVSEANFTDSSSLSQQPDRTNTSSNTPTPTLSKHANTSTLEASRTLSHQPTPTTSLNLTTSTVPTPSVSSVPTPTTTTLASTTLTARAVPTFTASTSFPTRTPSESIVPTPTMAVSPQPTLSSSLSYETAVPTTLPFTTQHTSGVPTPSSTKVATTSSSYSLSVTNTSITPVTENVTSPPPTSASSSGGSSPGSSSSAPPPSSVLPPPPPPAGMTPTTTPPATATAALTPTHQNTPSLTPVQYCDFTCNNIIAARVVSYDGVLSNNNNSASPAGQVADQYWEEYLRSLNTTATSSSASSQNKTTATSRGCAPLSIPFVTTSKGAVAHVLVHFDFTPSLPSTAIDAVVNNTFPLVGRTFYSSNPGAVTALGATTTILHGSIVVLDVRRIDAAPLSSTGGTISYPQGAFHCVPDTNINDESNNNDPLLLRGGLPYLAIKLEAPSPAIPDSEKNAIAAISALSPNMHTIAAINLLRCSPGALEDVESEVGIRALVPIALSASCVGAVEGAFLGIGIAIILSIVVAFVYKRVKGITWIEAASTTRCPGAILGVWSFLQMGLIICGGRLATDENGSHKSLGVAGVVVGAIVPIVCVGIVWGFVSRRSHALLQKYQREEQEQQTESTGVQHNEDVALPRYEATVLPVATIEGLSRVHTLTFKTNTCHCPPA